MIWNGTQCSFFWFEKNSTGINDDSGSRQNSLYLHKNIQIFTPELIPGLLKAIWTSIPIIRPYWLRSNNWSMFSVFQNDIHRYNEQTLIADVSTGIYITVYCSVFTVCVAFFISTEFLCYTNTRTRHTMSLFSVLKYSLQIKCLSCLNSFDVVPFDRKNISCLQSIALNKCWNPCPSTPIYLRLKDVIGMTEILYIFEVFFAFLLLCCSKTHMVSDASNLNKAKRIYYITIIVKNNWNLHNIAEHT